MIDNKRADEVVGVWKHLYLKVQQADSTLAFVEVRMIAAHLTQAYYADETAFAILSDPRRA